MNKCKLCIKARCGYGCQCECHKHDPEQESDRFNEATAIDGLATLFG